MELNRTVAHALLAWKQHSANRPLLLYGARQVGKTFEIKRFGASHYKNMAYFNFEEDSALHRIFEPDFAIARIIHELSLLFGRTIDHRDTLLVFDEIQRSNRALTSLKYFAEKAPEYQIIATGSMLGLSLGTGTYSFPVGKVQIVKMFPLTFDEFLMAVGKSGYVEHIRECYESNRPTPFHDELMGLMRNYLVVGGLPHVVKTWLETDDIFAAREEQRLLDAAYVADMTQYLSSIDAARALEVWRSMPHQLSKERRKFQYSTVRSGGRAYMYESALAWLKAAGVILTSNRSSEGIAPFIADDLGSYFKAYLFDCGMLCSKMIRNPSVLLSMDEPDSTNARFRGGLTENYVMQALSAKMVEPYYWESKGTAEIDFLIQDARGAAVPVEVKSGTNIRSRSLRVFVDKYDPPYAIRLSPKQFGMENGIKSVPLYAAFCV
jgi:predicted AAA+ superfamily ATPase